MYCLLHICSLIVIIIIHMFEKHSELLECDLAIPILVQLVHQGLQLLLTHAPAQLAQLPGVYRARVVSINSLSQHK